MSVIARPATLTEALALTAKGYRPLAGCTDLYPAAGPALHGDFIDLTPLADLNGITRAEGPRAGGLRIGACTTWSVVAEANLPPALSALQQAARVVGGRQIQNAGTIGGNLCNASPAADGIPPLLALDAEVELVSANGTRCMQLEDWLSGLRRVDLRDGEILSAINIPDTALKGRSAFAKLGARSHLVISIAMVAVRIVTQAGKITEARVAVGSCAPTARRLPAVESALIGAAPSEAPLRVAHQDLAQTLSPLDDIRATAAYRLTAATELIRRAVAEAAQ